MAYTPDKTTSYVLLVICLIFWGSWANTQRFAKFQTPDVSLFLMDYSIGLLFASLLFALTLGGDFFGDDEQSLVSNLQAHGSWITVGCCLAGGALFNVANTLLILGINMAGMSVAFPLAIGLAMSVGTVLDYIVQPEGNPYLIFGGVVLGVLAVISMGLSYFFKDRQAADDQLQKTRSKTDSSLGDSFDNSYQPSYSSGNEDALLDMPNAAAPADPKSPKKTNMVAAIIVCLVGGLLMGTWAPLVTRAQTFEGCKLLTPYTAFFLYCVATFLTMPFLSCVMQKATGANGSPMMRCRDYCQMPLWKHAWAWLGGLVWSVGTLFNMIAGNVVGFAVSYALGQCAPLVAALWGLLVWKEFKGAPCISFVMLGIMFVLYAGAIVSISLKDIGQGHNSSTVCKMNSHSGDHKDTDFF